MDIQKQKVSNGVDDPTPPNSKLYFAIAVAAGVIGIWFVYYTNSQATQEFFNLSSNMKESSLSPSLMRSLAKGHVEIQFEFGNGTKRRFAGNVGEDITLLDAVLGAANAGGIAVTLNGTSLAAIAGFENKTKHWVVYKNKEKISGAWTGVVVVNKDEFILRYE